MENNFTPEDIKIVYQRIRSKINKTNLYYADKLSKLNGNNIYLKLENLQKTGSFKVRGALNKILNLSHEEKKNGIVAASAGNHAQGVALAASNLGIIPTIVMPSLAPIAKIQATQNYGGKVILEGTFFDDALDKAIEISKKEGKTLIHAFDDIDIIKGQATIAYEIWEDLQNIDYCLVPIGGGGVMSGIASYLKQVNPKIIMIGVEAANVNSYEQALINKKPIKIESKPSIADGIAVKKVSALTYSLLTKYVDKTITVTEDEIAQAMLFLLESCKFVTEGSGAVCTAALLFDKLNIKDQNKNVVSLVTGGNVDITTLGNIINNALIQANRRVVIFVNSKIGNDAIIDIGNIVKENGAVIYKINSSLDRKKLNINNVNIKVVFDVSNKNQKNKIIKTIKKYGYDVVSF